MASSLIYSNRFIFGFFCLVCRVFLFVTGWKVVGELPPNKKFIAIAAPHTSNWDFPVFITIVGYFEMSVRFFGKDTLFKGPLGWFFYYLGGIPVKRGTRSATTLIDKAVESFNQNEEFILAIAPEGTRSSVSRWKTGFYRIAIAADVPILLAYLDAEKKEVGLSHLFHPTGDMEKDMAEIQAFYATKPGINPTNRSKKVHQGS